MKTYKFIDGIHACMILSSNAPNDPGPEYVLADEAKDSYNSGRDKGWSAGYHEGQVEMASCISAKDARIAEITAKYDSLEKSWIEGSGAHEESIAEASRYRVALEGIVMLNGGHRSETNSLLNDAHDIARNALKEGE